MFHVKHWKEVNMDISGVTQLIANFGFPIVAFCGCAYYVMRSDDKHRDEVTRLNEQHREESSRMVEAINNNTVALTKLCERME